MSVSPTISSRDASTSLPDDGFDVRDTFDPSGSAQKQSIPSMSRNVHFSSHSSQPNTSKHHHQLSQNPEPDETDSHPFESTGSHSTGISARDFADVHSVPYDHNQENTESKFGHFRIRIVMCNFVIFDSTRESIWRKLMMVNPSATLENTGSVARDHLASERTFLAYVRTSLAVASAGVGKSH